MKCRVMNERKLAKKLEEADKSLSAVSIASMLMVCEVKHRFGYDKMRKAAQQISYSFDSINCDYIDFDGLKEALEENDGVILPFDLKTYQACHTADDAQRIAEYTQKAFACAVLCTMLCDKFGFKQKKAQLAIKQFCSLFDELKRNRAFMKEYETHLLQKYSISLHEEESE